MNRNSASETSENENEYRVENEATDVDARIAAAVEEVDN